MLKEENGIVILVWRVYYGSYDILPSIKELSEIFQVTGNTVNKYLKELYKDDVLCFFFRVDVDIDKEFLDLKKFINVAKDWYLIWNSILYSI